MRHPDSKELQRFVDGELNRRHARKISAHLDECPECTEAVEAIRGTGDLLRLAFDQTIDDAELDGFADRVMEGIELDKPVPVTERVRVWFSEVFKHRRKFWAPPLALAGAAAAALLIVVFVGEEMPNRDLPGGSTVLSVSFGNSVDGTVFELEDKDGSTTAVIWVDESKSAPDAGEASLDSKGTTHLAGKSTTKSSMGAIIAARSLSFWGVIGEKVT